MTTEPPPPDSPDQWPPPEAVLLRRSREALDLTTEQAAPRLRIPLSARRWRQLEAGYATPDKPIRIPDKTLAHMAAVVRLTPEHLVGVGRAEAAEILRRLLEIQEAEQSERVLESGSADPYPPDVAGDPVLEQIWRIDAPRGERLTAVQSVLIYRRSMSALPPEEESRRRMA